MKSTAQKIQQCEGLLGTKDLSGWEEGFLRNIVAAQSEGDAAVLSEKQLVVLDRIYEKHFA